MLKGYQLLKLLLDHTFIIVFASVEKVDQTHLFCEYANALGP